MCIYFLLFYFFAFVGGDGHQSAEVSKQEVDGAFGAEEYSREWPERAHRTSAAATEHRRVRPGINEPILDAGEMMVLHMYMICRNLFKTL